MKKLKIGIVGAGVVGGILASHLVNSGQDVLICDIDQEHLDVCRKTGLEITGIKNMKVVLPICYTDLANLVSDKPDVLFLAVKSSTLEYLISSLNKIFHDDMLLVSYQNGLGVEDFLAEHFDKKNVARVVINYAGNIVCAGKINMTFFTGSNYIGGLDQKSKELCEKVAMICTSADLPTVYTSNIKVYEWEKVILNCSLSPISALTGLTMKTIMEDPMLRQMVDSTLAECIKVAQAQGVEFLQDDFHKFGMDYLDKAGHHKPSMLVDVENMQKTEISFLNQKVSEYGQKLGVETPYNTMLARMVYGIDKRNAEKKKE